MTEEIQKDVIGRARPWENKAIFEGVSADGMVVVGSSRPVEVPAEKINEMLNKIREKGLKYSFKLDND